MFSRPTQARISPVDGNVGHRRERRALWQVRTSVLEKARIVKGVLARKRLIHNKSERYFVSCMGPVQTRHHFSPGVAGCLRAAMYLSQTSSDGPQLQ